MKEIKCIMAVISLINFDRNIGKTLKNWIVILPNVFKRVLTLGIINLFILATLFKNDVNMLLFILIH